MRDPEQPPIDLSPQDWREVVRILREQVPGMEVWAFGSRAKRTAKPYSDLDLALITPQPLPLSQRAAVNDAFANSDLSVRVDVVDWAASSESFRAIMAHGKVVVQFPD